MLTFSFVHRGLIGSHIPRGLLIHKETLKITIIVSPKGGFLVELFIFRETSGICSVDWYVRMPPCMGCDPDNPTMT